MGPAEVLKFWFEEITPELRFAKNADLDQKIRERFHDVFESAASGKTSTWRTSPEGRLAEIIVLDRPSTAEEVEFLREEGSSF